MTAGVKNKTVPDNEFSTFYLGDALFGINLLDIHEINRHSTITRIPQAPEDLKGILNLRGHIVTIFDLGLRLGLSKVRTDNANRNIIVQSRGELVGLTVDAIDDIVKARDEDLVPAPSNIKGVQGKFFKGVLKNDSQLIGILDLDNILEA